MSELINCKSCEKPISKSAKSCPSCGRPTGKPIYKKGWFIGLAVLFGLFLVGKLTGANESDASSAETSSESNSPPSEQPSAPEPAITLPEGQTNFSAVVFGGKYAYQTSPNELKKSVTRTIRKEHFATELKGNFKFENWIGKLTVMKTNSEGNAYVTIQSANKQFSVKTWSNAVSDIQDETLIPQDSDLFDAISGLEKNSMVRFSGEFVPSEQDTVREASVTERGSMTDPEFIVHFSSIEKL